MIAAVFLYTTAVNIAERPDGVKIGACFIAGIILVSLLSRLKRAFELRVTDATFDEAAERFIRDCTHRPLRLIANEPNGRDLADYQAKKRQIRADNDIPAEDDLAFVEVTVLDPSEFEAALTVRGEVLHGRYRVLSLESSSVPNALAALLLAVRDRTGQQPHIYFEWTEGNPFAQFFRFFLFGQGEVAPVTREVLREAEPDRSRRPRVHVGQGAAWRPETGRRRVGGDREATGVPGDSVRVRKMYAVLADRHRLCGGAGRRGRPGRDVRPAGQ